MQISFDAYRQDEQLDKPLILRRPDADEPLEAFLEKTTLSLALNGNAFWRIYRDNQGRVTGLRVLNPHDVVIQADNEGNVTAYKYAFREQPFTKNEVHHLSHMRVAGSPRGRGPIQSARVELYGAINARDYANFWFDEAGVPTGILSTDLPLSDPAQAQAVKDAWTETQGGQRGVAVLGQGFKYNPVYLSPEDAQWIQVRQFDVTSIARLFGIPAGLLLAAIEGSSQTYSNISQAWTEFQKFTLSRYVIEIEAAFSAVLPRGTEVKANYAALLAPDIVTRYTLHTQALTAGFMSINEVRDIEGLEPAPDGDFKTSEQKIAEQQAFAAPAPTEEEEASDE
jgi:HK97 family phage portal protein